MSTRVKRARWFRRVVTGARPVVRTMARSLSRGDAALAEDLEQEGLIAIWQMVPAELRRFKHPQQVAVGRAWRAMRRYRLRQRYKVEAPEAQVLSWWERRQGRAVR